MSEECETGEGACTLMSDPAVYKMLLANKCKLSSNGTGVHVLT